ncbi:MAG: hypothetical protein KDA75_10785, partial [Planctomycetaceae bacterium]|nr:hypothetical protein [Planctomycetaceae bacterium]
MSELFSGPIHDGLTIGELPSHNYRVPRTLLAEEAAAQLRTDPKLPGIMILEHHGGPLVGVISRTRLLDLLSQSFGRELYLKRPVGNMLGDRTTLVLPATTPVPAAASAALGRPTDEAFEPLVAAFPDRPPLLIDAHVLLIAQSQMLAFATAT